MRTDDPNSGRKLGPERRHLAWHAQSRHPTPENVRRGQLGTGEGADGAARGADRCGRGPGADAVGRGADEADGERTEADAVGAHAARRA